MLLLHGLLASLLGFKALSLSKTAFLYALTQRLLPYFFLYLQSLNRIINNLITYFVPLLFISLTCLNLFVEGRDLSSFPNILLWFCGIYYTFSFLILFPPFIS